MIQYDPIPSSLNQNHKNCMIDSKENYYYESLDGKMLKKGYTKGKLQQY